MEPFTIYEVAKLTGPPPDYEVYDKVQEMWNSAKRDCWVTR